MARHRAMIARNNICTDLRYRKRPEPCRVVSLDSLRRTDSENTNNDGPFVSHTGILEMPDSSKPVTSPQSRIEVSKRGWDGLHSRLMSSLAIHAEVA
tara:strand:- start:172 stop:462 length:291 start_codon:yes stop_codon:yes gene_type:complete